MASLQLCLGLIHLSQLTQETVLKIALGISLPVPQPTFLLHEGLMVAAGLWPPFLLLAMVQTHPAQLFLHPVRPKKSCTSYHTNQHLMNYIFYLNISVPLKALRVITGAGPLQCVRAPEVSALDVLLPAVTMK